MELITLTLVTLISLISLFNFATARSLKPTNSTIEGSVAILIPMRNEADNAQGVVTSALSQSNLETLKVYALDDHSSDDTQKILNTIKDERFEFKVGESLPDGWLGKNFALHSLSEDRNESYLVFLDADVRLEPNAVASAISLMEKLDWDYISPYPRQIANGFLSRTVQPLLQWSWFATLPLRLIEKSKRPSTVVANGQFFIVRSAAYQASGGHIAIKNEVLDDLELARSLRRIGAHGSVVDASRVSSCEMYQKAKDLVSGYSKSQWRAFGGFFGATIAISLMFITSVLPALMLFTLEPWAITSYLAVVATRLMAAARTKSVMTTAPIHPFAISIWIYLIFRSITLKQLGRLEWRGRTI